MVSLDLLPDYIRENGTVLGFPQGVPKDVPGATPNTTSTPVTAPPVAVPGAEPTKTITTNTAVISTLIPGEGIRFTNGVYIVLPANASVTTFYG